MSDHPLVSVIVPTADRLPLLQEAVASVRAQRDVRWELIVVVDASTDGTTQWLRQQDDLVVLEQPTRLGTASTRNAGLRAARGDYVWFLDDDDRLLSNALVSMLELHRRPHLDVAVGARIRLEQGAPPARIGHPTRLMERDVHREVLAEWNPVPSQVLYRADALTRLGGFRRDLTQVEDRELFARFAFDGRVLLVPDAVVEYRVHAGNMPRGSHVRTLRDKALDSFVEHVPANRRARARRLRAQGRRWQNADDAMDAGHYRAAAAGYLRIAASTPELFTSPVTGSVLRWRLSRSLERAVHVRRAAR